MVSGTQDAEASLYLHAELLPNIRQITLYVSVRQSPALGRVRPVLHLSESRRAVTVSLLAPFDNVVETIKLPGRASDVSQRNLNITTSPALSPGPDESTSSTYDYSFRLPIDPDEKTLVSRDEAIDEYVPWTAGDMSPLTRLRCRECASIFLDAPSSAPSDVSEGQTPSQGWVWKDLPSGNWAEMMDFWHCHKPDPHEDASNVEASMARHIEGQTAHVKGYGASSRVVATSGTVLVDVATFLLAESDCAGLRKVRMSFMHWYAYFPAFCFKPHQPSLACYRCYFFCWATRRRPFRFHEMVSDTIALYRNKCIFMLAIHLEGSSFGFVFRDTGCRYPLLQDGFRSPVLPVMNSYWLPEFHLYLDLKHPRHFQLRLLALADPRSEVGTA